ncbi:hypothetical protein [Pseudomonas rossensis]|jgi:hypothetical protein|uniref:hypothetical protein n=1 Tax=Pseudomonas rossensis TaxID=2305471 RepID=UPI003260735B
MFTNKTFTASQWLKRISLIIGLLVVSACSHTTLEEQFKGIEACNIHDIFLDPVTNKPSGQYFSDRKLEPCRIDEAAFYCVNDTFYGLTVTQVAIPYRGPFSVHAIYLKESPAVAEAALRAQFKDLKLNQNDGQSPLLIADPKQQGSSVFYCDEYSE